MIPVTLDKDAEQQVAVSSGPTFRRRRLFIAMGLAAGGLLILALALLGYNHKNDASRMSMPSVQSGPIQGQDGTVDPSSSSVSTVLPISPLQMVPYMFKKYTVPTVSITAILVLLVVLAVVLPVVLSQSVEEVPVVVDPEPFPNPTPTPEPEPEPEPGFFDSSLNLGLTVTVIVVGVIVIGAVGFWAYRGVFSAKENAETDAIQEKLTISKIMSGYRRFIDSITKDPTEDAMNCLGGESFEELAANDEFSVTIVPGATLRQYNEALARKYNDNADESDQNLRLVILTAIHNGKPLWWDQILTEQHDVDMVAEDLDSLGEYYLEDLENILDLVESFNRPVTCVGGMLKRIIR